MKYQISTPKDRLKLLCHNLGISQVELAKKAKLRESSISNYISGFRIPSTDALCRIAEATNTSIDWLMGYGGDEQFFSDDYDEKLLRAYWNADVEIQKAINTLLNLDPV